MTGSLEIKITISEFVTPALFQAMSAVSNPRQRASLIKRLAEDALRGTVNAGQASFAVGSVNATDSVAMSPPPQSEATPVVPSGEPRRLVSQSAPPNEDGRQFDYAFLADKLGDFE